MTDPVRIGALLTRATGRLGISTRLHREAAVFFWPRVVGEDIARRTHPGPVLKNGFLLVTTPNPALAHQLVLLEKEILSRYRKLMGGSYLRGIRVQIGQVEEKPSPVSSPGPEEETALSPEKEAEIKAMVDKIPDRELAAVFLRAALAWARKKKGTGGAEEEYLRLVLGDTWPTAEDLARSWAEIAPHRREEVKRRAEEELRAKIFRRLTGGGLSPAESLGLRGDLRRLALLMGRAPRGEAHRLAVELLGPEVAAIWPGEDQPYPEEGE